MVTVRVMHYRGLNVVHVMQDGTTKAIINLDCFGNNFSTLSNSAKDTEILRYAEVIAKIDINGKLDSVETLF